MVGGPSDGRRDRKHAAVTKDSLAERSRRWRKAPFRKRAGSNTTGVTSEVSPHFLVFCVCDAEYQQMAVPTTATEQA